MSNVQRHEDRVSRVACQLRKHDASHPVVIQKKTSSHVVPKRHDLRWRDAPVDISDLNHVLDIDVSNRTCTAESGATFQDVVRATLPHGLIPAVVPELATITVGGAVTGCSIESMSFKLGGFHDTCIEYEVVTSSGEVLRCSQNENPLVFQMIHGSFGTLGVLTTVKMKLVPAKKFVHVRYERHRTLEKWQRAIWRIFNRAELDFMDGFIHARDEHVLCLGEFTDEAPYSNRYDWTKVYYRSTRTRKEDFLPTEQYLFRYDRGVTNVHPKSALGRLLFGKFATSDRLLRLARKIPRLLPKTPTVTVDMLIPFSRLGPFFDWYRGAIDFYPLWCVPYRRVRDYEWIAKGYFDDVNDPLFVDLAIYGLTQPANRNLYAEIEVELERVHGIKTLISYNYYDQETFWRIWNKPNYDAVKSIMDPTNVFRDLYSKTVLLPRGIAAP